MEYKFNIENQLIIELYNNKYSRSQRYSSTEIQNII